MNDVQVRNLVLGDSSESILSKRTKASRFRWFGHVLRMANARLPHHALFFVPFT